MNITNVPIVVTICVSLLTAIIGPIVVEFAKRMINKIDAAAQDAMYADLEGSVLIEEQIEILHERTDADRIWVTQFHNGGHFYASGASIKKFSVFYESVNTGISRIQQMFQNTPTSFFSKSLKEIHDNDNLEVSDMQDPNICSFGLRDNAAETGCRALFLVALKTPSGKLHGSLGVEFVKEPHKFTEDEKDDIISAATYISGILSSMH